MIINDFILRTTIIPFINNLIIIKSPLVNNNNIIKLFIHMKRVKKINKILYQNLLEKNKII